MSDKKHMTSKEVDSRSVDLAKFQGGVLDEYRKGCGDYIPSDELSARSLMPPMTAAQRNFSTVASELPMYHSDKCIACMECVIACPDAAIRARVTTEENANTAMAKFQTGHADEATKAFIKSKFAKTARFWNTLEKKGQKPGLFSIWIDPTKCKGCGECVEVCSDSHALNMLEKNDMMMTQANKALEFVDKILPPTQQEFINPKLSSDVFLRDDRWIYKGGAGSCMGCGEITALKMAMTATSERVGPKNMVIVASTGCNSVFSATYPYSIFGVPWTNSLFENAPTTALGVRLRLNQEGKQNTAVWVVGGDGAMLDIGLQPLSRVLATGENIKILVMDTQVYSNTGGQASTSTYLGQNAKLSAAGKAAKGKTERRKELGLISMMHPDSFVAQVSTAHYNHFIKTIMDAVDFPGPAVIIAYSPCMPEHGVADNSAYDRSKAAVMSRAFPLYVYDPRKGNTLKERLSLNGNPSISEDWHKDPKTGEAFDFVWFARQEGRFAQLFDKEGKPSELLLRSQDDRLRNWKTLQELAAAK